MFCIALGIVLTAMGWVSLEAVRLDRAAVRARQTAAREDTIRLAMWRMDSLLSALLAEESARSPLAYTAFRPAEAAYSNMFAPVKSGDVLLPSPLLTQRSRFVYIHFQINPDNTFVSPQAPTGNMLDLAEELHTTPDETQKAARRLEGLKAHLSQELLLAILRATGSAAENQVALAQPVPQIFYSKEAREYAQRAEQIDRYNTIVRAQQQSLQGKTRDGKLHDSRQAPPDTPPSMLADIPESPLSEHRMRPLWIDDTLLLVRRITRKQGDYIQGCHLDWPALRTWLLSTIGDTLAEATLVPIRTGDAVSESRILANLPVRLLLGSPPAASIRASFSTRLTLSMAWAGMLLAATAVAVLLRDALSLSDRRAAFVSAVTHEMRTPLTTFRMYTEMLSDGMVAEQSRDDYVAVLRSEADRLAHMVENVLAYARLEQAPGAAMPQEFRVREMLARSMPRLEMRAEQAGMQILLEADEQAGDAVCKGAASVVEQILLNLVDNACKYAVSAEDRRILVDVTCTDGAVVLNLRDHGPGIAIDERKRIFRPFHKSAREAAETAPGVGLGLALSRRLARAFGGDLVLDPDGQRGACFRLTLPRR
jgi:signal transduction histidine kinase